MYVYKPCLCHFKSAAFCLSNTNSLFQYILSSHSFYQECLILSERVVLLFEQSQLLFDLFLTYLIFRRAHNVINSQYITDAGITSIRWPYEVLDTLNYSLRGGCLKNTICNWLGQTYSTVSTNAIWKEI